MMIIIATAITPAITATVTPRCKGLLSMCRSNPKPGALRQQIHAASRAFAKTRLTNLGMHGANIKLPAVRALIHVMPSVLCKISMRASVLPTLIYINARSVSDSML